MSDVNPRWDQYVEMLRKVAEVRHNEQRAQSYKDQTYAERVASAQAAVNDAAERGRGFDQRLKELRDSTMAKLAAAGVSGAEPSTPITVAAVSSSEDADRAIGRLQTNLDETIGELGRVRAHTAESDRLRRQQLAGVAIAVAAAVLIRIRDGSLIDALASGIIVLAVMVGVQMYTQSIMYAVIGGAAAAAVQSVAIVAGGTWWMGLIAIAVLGGVYVLRAQRQPDTQKTIEEVGKAMIRAAPSVSWRAIRLAITGAGTVVQVQLEVDMKSGAVDTMRELDRQGRKTCEQLRDEMYTPGKGAWYNARFMIDRSTMEVQSNFDYENPPFDGVIHEKLLLKDQKMKPRDTALLPEWHPAHKTN